MLVALHGAWRARDTAFGHGALVCKLLLAGNVQDGMGQQLLHFRWELLSAAADSPQISPGARLRMQQQHIQHEPAQDPARLWVRDTARRGLEIPAWSGSRHGTCKRSSQQRRTEKNNREQRCTGRNLSFNSTAVGVALEISCRCFGGTATRSWLCPRRGLGLIIAGEGCFPAVLRCRARLPNDWLGDP